MIIGSQVHGPDGADLNYCIVALDLQRISWLLDHIALVRILKRGNDEIYALEVFDYAPEFYATDDDQELLDQDGWQALPKGYAPQEFQMVNPCTVVITDDCVLWRAKPKHGDREVETVELMESTLKSLLIRLARVEP